MCRLVCVCRQLASGELSQMADPIVGRFELHLLSVSGLEPTRRTLLRAYSFSFKRSLVEVKGSCQ